MARTHCTAARRRRPHLQRRRGRILRGKGFRGIVRNLGLGVDVGRFAPAPVRSGEPGIRVGYVGRLEPHKGVATLVEAVASVPGCSLDVVGDGPERETLERLIAARRLSDRVRIRGYTSHDDLPDVYRGFDILAVPSLETPRWVEQFGRVAVEGMATALPVVASDSGSLPEVIGGAGVLVPPADPSALAAALQRLCDDATERGRLGTRGRERAGYFSWANTAQRQRALYWEVLADGR